MKSLVTYFKCGRYICPNHQKWGYYQCTKFSDNYNIILPFFKKYLIKGEKGKDFSDWVKVAELIKKGAHLTKEGVSEIINLKAGMNKGRIYPQNIPALRS